MRNNKERFAPVAVFRKETPATTPSITLSAEALMFRSPRVSLSGQHSSIFLLTTVGNGFTNGNQNQSTSDTRGASFSGSREKLKPGFNSAFQGDRVARRSVGPQSPSPFQAANFPLHGVFLCCISDSSLRI